MPKLISELLDLPEQVRKGDFVLNLSHGITDPEATLRDYVVTEQLAGCFEDAMSFIQSAVEAGNSKACYLHGSFGSGKSHFMAVLHLLLQHNAQARAITELAGVCDKNQWVEDKKFLLVPYHMIGARNMESAILGGYVDYVREHHPEAPLPGVYVADEIFANASDLRDAMGDEKFFEKLNTGESGGGGWGKLEGWNAARFETALNEPPGSKERSQLVGKLVQHILPAFKGVANQKDEAYVDLDEGLAIISEHSKDLGYHGLILFLDELILWLATHSGDINFVQLEGNKLAKLVEARHANRPVPVVSFVARQRDLRDLIGGNVTGVNQLNFSDVLSHWEGRFHTITLEDRNLPVIAQKRVLRPKDAACRAELEAAFEDTAKVRQEIMEILLTREADRTMFKMVYPFSPALIQSLVAVSSALQRERTALKIMLQLLVNRRDTLELGDVIPLGDLWDVVAYGDEAFTDVMKVRFENAKKLYQTKLFPLLERTHDLDHEVDRERAKTDEQVAARLKQFDNDDRLIKSLLLASLVQGVEALRNMNCLRLAALNHGTIRSRIPGREHQMVAGKFRSWAGEVGEIRVGEDPSNPTVSVELEGVDTESIIESARQYDNAGNRQSKIRSMLFRALSIEDSDEMFLQHAFLWRGTKRNCQVLFANVRELTDEALRSPDGWKLILDFPFDADGHTPVDDLSRITKFRDRQEKQQTLVWLPAFFSAKTQGELAKLVVIDHLLRGNNLDLHSQHLSAQERETARTILRSQQSTLTSRLTSVLEAAYNIRSEPTPGSLDASYDMSEEHFQSLYPSLTLQRPGGATLGEALERLLDQALSHQFPKHPKFEQEVKLGKDFRRVLEVCEAAAQAQDGRYYVDDKGVRAKVRSVCNPLELGEMHETHFVLGNTWRNQFNKQLAAAGKDSPEVADLRQWMDQPEERGLPKEIQNLLILVYAHQTNRSFKRYGGAFQPTLDDVPNDLELVEEQLPDTKDWEKAVQTVADLFGHSISKLPNATNLALFTEKVGASVREFREHCDQLPDRIQLILRDLGEPDSQLELAERVKTASAVKQLLTDCDGKDGSTMVKTVAYADLQPSGITAGKSIKSASTVMDVLRNTKWDLLQGIKRLTDERKTQAESLLSDVRGWLKANELDIAGGLKDRLRDAERRAVELLTPNAAAQPEPPTGGGRDDVFNDKDFPKPISAGGKRWRPVSQGRKEHISKQDWHGTIEELNRKLEANPKLRLSVQWTLEEEELE